MINLLDFGRLDEWLRDRAIEVLIFYRRSELAKLGLPHQGDLFHWLGKTVKEDMVCEYCGRKTYSTGYVLFDKWVGQCCFSAVETTLLEHKEGIQAWLLGCKDSWYHPKEGRQLVGVGR